MRYHVIVYRYGLTKVIFGTLFDKVKDANNYIDKLISARHNGEDEFDRILSIDRKKRITLREEH